MLHVIFLVLALVASCLGAALPEERIVGGSNAVLGAVPWQVSLRQNNGHFCGGSVLNQRYVLTAAHCLTSVNVAQVTAVTNTVVLNSGGDHYRVSRVIIHPSYNAWLIRHDVGLVQTTTNIVYRANTVQPARLPTSHFSTVNAAAVVSGWGRTSFPGNGANHLQILTVSTTSQADCRASSWRVTDENICTFNRAGQGTCHGDSGGPLSVSGVLIGIVSFGTPCATGVPDAYARVFTYLNWIVSNAR